MQKSLKDCKITPKKIELLNKIGIYSSDDMLSYYPFRYEQLEAKPFDQWNVNDKVIFECTLVSYPKTFRYGNRAITRFDVEMEENYISITIYNRPWVSNLKVNQYLVITGKYEGKNKVIASNYNGHPLNEQLGVMPVYPLKAGLTQKNVHDLVKKVYDQVEDSIQDFIPETYIHSYKLLHKDEALRMIHFPKSLVEVKTCYRTLKYEEFLKFYIAILLSKNEGNTMVKKQGKVFDVDQVFMLANHLSYHLTNDQIKVTNEIIEDLQSTKVMYRLVQGDVGCGKTLVSALGLYACYLSGKQGALLAPTEILAKQHYDALKKLFRVTELKVEVLYAALPSAKKKEIAENLKNGSIDILIGTHSIFSDSIHFKNLGMVVADEQQRFGVEQRRKLKEKGDKVDFLLMSATPIPRTLANAIYGDMDISTIVTMPPGRKQVYTKLIQENSFRSILKDIYAILEEGRQIYVICAAIEENENYDARDVNQIYSNLQKEFKDYKVGMLHGKMSSEEKEEVMHAFEKNEIQILVSTTVVEVGVNVVNATCMIIYDAHRFGLSQLHQLRGRVQRGSEQGKCFLLTDSKDLEAIKRLQVLENTTNGFDISLEDLRMRGPGDILGTRQSGIPGFILGNLVEDTKIMQQAKKDAQVIVEDLHNPMYASVVKEIVRINKNSLQFMD